ncbi:MAG: hypothetical protein ACP5K7_08240 [Verrucomicrobiia bacterium]|jgi:hypothetical protein
MSQKEHNREIKQTRLKPALALMATFLILAAIISIFAYIRSDVIYEKPINSERVQERLKAQAEVEAATKTLMDSYGWQDRTRTVVRLPISLAMEIVARAYQNPLAARSNFIKRLEWSTRPLTQQTQPTNKQTEKIVQ